jgi:hypothetical protein
MKITHFEEERIYVISNHAVARNPIFGTKKVQNYFIEKMDFYLSPIAEIIGFNLINHEFQIMVKLRTREDFMVFYKSRARYEEEEIIPESTYIFSRVMSNLQVSLVKKFNFLFQREGTLMAARFTREEIEGAEELVEWIEKMNSGKMSHKHSGIWTCQIMNGQKAMTSEGLYNLDNDAKRPKLCSFLNGIKNDLVGNFNTDENRTKFPPINYHYRHFFKALIHFQV